MPLANRRRGRSQPQADPYTSEPTDDLIVVDISHWQDDPIDWDAVRGNGIVGVILKATQGVSYLDDTFHDRYQAARSAGLCVSSYHFLEHGSIASQMQWYLDQAMPDQGERVVIDYEEDSCRIDDLYEAVSYLLADTRNLQVTCYGASMLTDHVNGASQSQQEMLRNTSLWAARYSSNQPVIATSVWPYWSLWQYTDNASVPGFNGPVDGNRFNGSRENCIAWFGPAGEVEPIPPQPGPNPRVDLKVNVPKGVDLAIQVNDHEPIVWVSK